MKVKKGFDLTRLRTEYGFNYDDDNGIYKKNDGWKYINIKSWNGKIEYDIKGSDNCSILANTFFRLIKDGVLELDEEGEKHENTNS